MNKLIQKISRMCEESGRCEAGLTDLVTGSMSPEDASKEVQQLFDIRTPQGMIMVMEKRKDSDLYQTSLYISKEDFSNSKNARFIDPRYRGYDKPCLQERVIEVDEDSHMFILRGISVELEQGLSRDVCTAFAKEMSQYQDNIFLAKQGVQASLKGSAKNPDDLFRLHVKKGDLVDVSAHYRHRDLFHGDHKDTIPGKALITAYDFLQGAVPVEN